MLVRHESRPRWTWLEDVGRAGMPWPSVRSGEKKHKYLQCGTPSYKLVYNPDQLVRSIYHKSYLLEL